MGTPSPSRARCWYQNLPHQNFQIPAAGMQRGTPIFSAIKSTSIFIKALNFCQNGQFSLPQILNLVMSYYYPKPLIYVNLKLIPFLNLVEVFYSYKRSCLYFLTTVSGCFLPIFCHESSWNFQNFQKHCQILQSVGVEGFPIT